MGRELQEPQQVTDTLVTLKNSRDERPDKIHWRDRLAMLLVLWVAELLLTDRASPAARREIREHKVALSVHGHNTPIERD